MRPIRGSHQSRGLSEMSPVPGGVQRGAGLLLHGEVTGLRMRTQEFRFGTVDVDDRMQADRLGDDPAPPSLERPHDVALGLGRRSGRQQKRILEPQTGEGDRE